MPILSTFGAASARSMGLRGRAKKLVTKTFTSSQSWPCPPGVALLVSAVGKGADGSPASTAWANNIYIDTVQGSATGTGSSSGALAWESFTEAAGIVAAINNGTQGGGWNGVNYTGHPNSNTYDISLVRGIIVTPYVQGSASASYSAGWKSSGSVLASDYGQSFISYQYTNPATTGASATGFGKTFPGGAGGAASTTTFNNVAVTPGTNYPINVPAGGSITITYYQ